jgi:hypothetical protein
MFLGKVKSYFPTKVKNNNNNNNIKIFFLRKMKETLGLSP